MGSSASGRQAAQPLNHAMDRSWPNGTHNGSHPKLALPCGCAGLFDENDLAHALVWLCACTMLLLFRGMPVA